MPVLNTADKLYLGNTLVDAAYVSDMQVWATYSSTVLSDSPWGYWPLNGNANDALGLHNGTPDAGVTWEAGLVNQCARIHGGTEAIRVGPGDLLSPVPAMTLEAWFNLSSVPTGIFGLMSSDNSSVDQLTRNWFVRVQASGTIRAGFGVGGVVNVSTTAGNICTGVWRHIVVTKASGSGLQIYIDGVLSITGVASTGNIQASGVSPITLGHYGALADPYSMNGPLDECAIYTYALSPQRILAHYQARVRP